MNTSQTKDSVWTSVWVRSALPSCGTHAYGVTGEVRALSGDAGRDLASKEAQND